MKLFQLYPKALAHLTCKSPDSLQARANTQSVSQPPGGIALHKKILNPFFAVKPEASG